MYPNLSLSDAYSLDLPLGYGHDMMVEPLFLPSKDVDILSHPVAMSVSYL